jgi:hypothetical protein
MRMDVSSEADARYTLSDVQAMSERPFVCPFKLRTSSPVKGFQIFTSLSLAIKGQKISPGYSNDRD